ncbi:hypothetical protein TcWFU_010329 [Taenia crassiceps]|uniref:Uncharacterized protein n=1 Tax=Taenia crassiceps TaxID=6207 RepID=A0ABR4QNC8_9CEST
MAAYNFPKTSRCCLVGDILGRRRPGCFYIKYATFACEQKGSKLLHTCIPMLLEVILRRSAWMLAFLTIGYNLNGYINLFGSICMRTSMCTKETSCLVKRYFKMLLQFKNLEQSTGRNVGKEMTIGFGGGIMMIKNHVSQAPPHLYAFVNLASVCFAGISLAENKLWLVMSSTKQPMQHS